MEQEINEVTLNDFPDCALLCLLEYLDSTALYQLSKVNSRFADLALTKSLWIRIDGRREPNTEEKIDFILDRITPQTERILMKRRLVYPLLSRIMKDHPDRFKNLTILSLENQFFKKYVKLDTFPNSLIELSFRDSSFEWSSEFFRKSSEAMSNLRVLILDGCHQMSSSTLMSVSKYPNLEILSCYKCPIENSVAYFSLAVLNGFKKLKVFDVRLTGFGNTFLKSFIRKENLLVLYFQNRDTSYEIDYKNRVEEAKRLNLPIPRYIIETLSSTGNEDILITDYGTLDLSRTIAVNGESTLPKSFLYVYPYPPCTCGFKEKQEELKLKLEEPVVSHSAVYVRDEERNLVDIINQDNLLTTPPPLAHTSRDRFGRLLRDVAISRNTPRGSFPSDGQDDNRTEIVFALPSWRPRNRYAELVERERESMVRELIGSNPTEDHRRPAGNEPGPSSYNILDLSVGGSSTDSDGGQPRGLFELPGPSGIRLRSLGDGRMDIHGDTNQPESAPTSSSETSGTVPCPLNSDDTFELPGSSGVFTNAPECVPIASSEVSVTSQTVPCPLGGSVTFELPENSGGAGDRSVGEEKQEEVSGESQESPTLCFEASGASESSTSDPSAAGNRSEKISKESQEGAASSSGVLENSERVENLQRVDGTFELPGTSGVSQENLPSTSGLSATCRKRKLDVDHAIEDGKRARRDDRSSSSSSDDETDDGRAAVLKAGTVEPQAGTSRGERGPENVDKIVLQDPSDDNSDELVIEPVLEPSERERLDAAMARDRQMRAERSLRSRYPVRTQVFQCACGAHSVIVVTSDEASGGAPVQPENYFQFHRCEQRINLNEHQSLRVINRNLVPNDRPEIELINRNRKTAKCGLTQLSLRGYHRVTNVTLKSIEHLHLELLDITYTQCTKQGVMEFLRFNPNCRVVHPDFCVCRPKMDF